MLQSLNKIFYVLRRSKNRFDLDIFTSYRKARFTSIKDRYPCDLVTPTRFKFHNVSKQGFIVDKLSLVFFFFFNALHVLHIIHKSVLKYRVTPVSALLEIRTRTPSKAGPDLEFLRPKTRQPNLT